jgi:hypothetical protein
VVAERVEKEDDEKNENETAQNKDDCQQMRETGEKCDHRRQLSIVFFQEKIIVERNEAFDFVRRWRRFADSLSGFVNRQDDLEIRKCGQIIVGHLSFGAIASCRQRDQSKSEHEGRGNSSSDRDLLGKEMASGVSNHECFQSRRIAVFLDHFTPRATIFQVEETLIRLMDMLKSNGDLDGLVPQDFDAFEWNIEGRDQNRSILMTIEFDFRISDGQFLIQFDQHLRLFGVELVGPGVVLIEINDNPE